jgi:hypothetical protein
MPKTVALFLSVGLVALLPVAGHGDSSVFVQLTMLTPVVKHGEPPVIRVSFINRSTEPLWVATGRWAEQCLTFVARKHGRYLQLLHGDSVAPSDPPYVRLKPGRYIEFTTSPSEFGALEPGTYQARATYYQHRAGEREYSSESNDVSFSVTVRKRRSR